MQTQCADPQHEVNDYFESSSAYWKDIYRPGGLLLPTIYQTRHNTALDWIRELGLDADARILEVGCGAGLTSVILAKNGHTVDAMDSTKAMLQMTRRNAGCEGVEDRIRLHLGDVHALPFAARTFDLVIAVGVIPWLHSAGVALQEMQRVLKHGGYLLASADNNARLNRVIDPASSPIFAPLRAAAKRMLQLCGLWTPASGFQPRRHYPRQVNRLMRGCDFKEIRACTVGFGPFTLFGKELFTDPMGVRLHRRLQMLASRQGWSPVRWTGVHYLLLAAKV